MNKKKGIIIGIFALVVTMIIGYAYFSKNIEIKGTATASGNFNLSYTCEAYNDNGTGTGTCTVEGNKIITTSNLTKPTEITEFTITITNNGTIPAVLKTIDSPNNYDYEKLTSSELVAGDSVYVDTKTMLSAIWYFTTGESAEIVLGDSTIKAANITIQPGESLALVVKHIWADSALLNMEQPKLPEGGATMEYNVTLGFEQTNN